jgi:Flp pilus assembly protein TadD
LAPGHPAAHYHLGEALTGLDQLEQAEQHLHLALAAEPNVAATHNALASVLLRQGLHSQAEQSFRDALVLDPTSPFSHANLALVLSRHVATRRRRTRRTRPWRRPAASGARWTTTIST